MQVNLTISASPMNFYSFVIELNSKIKQENKSGIFAPSLETLRAIVNERDVSEVIFFFPSEQEFEVGTNARWTKQLGEIKVYRWKDVTLHDINLLVIQCEPERWKEWMPHMLSLVTELENRTIVKKGAHLLIKAKVADIENELKKKEKQQADAERAAQNAGKYGGSRPLTPGSPLPSRTRVDGMRDGTIEQPMPTSTETTDPIRSEPKEFTLPPESFGKGSYPGYNLGTAKRVADAFPKALDVVKKDPDSETKLTVGLIAKKAGIGHEVCGKYINAFRDYGNPNVYGVPFPSPRGSRKPKKRI